MERILLPVVVALALLAYGSGVLFGFAYDDWKTIVYNPALSTEGAWKDLFSARYFIHSGEESYRLLVTATYFIEHALAGKSPWIYHLTSILMHVANAALVFLFARAILANSFWAFLAAAIFAVHPVGSEAVSAVSFREDLMVVLFLLPAWFFAAKALGGEQRRWLHVFACCLFFFAACLSKENAIVFPVLILAGIVGGIFKLDPSSQKMTKPAVALVGALCGVAVVYLVIWGVVLTKPKAFQIPPLGGSGLTAVLNVPKVYFTQFAKLLWPVDLSADYAFAPITGISALSISLLIGFVVLIALAIVLLLKQSPLGFGICWMLITLAPVSNLLPLTNPVADRYLYLPLVGFGVVMVQILSAAYGKMDTLWGPDPARRISMVLGAAILIFFYGVTSLAAHPRWGSDQSLWEATVKQNPNSYRAYYRLGDLARERAVQYRNEIPEERAERAKELDAAEACLNRAVELAPEFSDALNALGSVQMMRGRIDEAIEIFLKVLEIDEDHGSATINLAQANVLKNPPDAAAALMYLEKAKTREYPVPEAFEAWIRKTAEWESP